MPDLTATTFNTLACHLFDSRTFQRRNPLSPSKLKSIPKE